MLSQREYGGFSKGRNRGSKDLLMVSGQVTRATAGAGKTATNKSSCEGAEVRKASATKRKAQSKSAKKRNAASMTGRKGEARTCG